MKTTPYPRIAAIMLYVFMMIVIFSSCSEKTRHARYKGAKYSYSKMANCPAYGSYTMMRTNFSGKIKRAK